MNSVQDAVNVVSTAQEDGDAAASAKPEQQQPPTASIDAPATTSASRSSPSVPSASATGEHAQQPSIEEDVKQLVSDVSSWWSGFSKRSQEQINQARAQIDAQGGIVSIARREAQKFEAQLTEAQRAAREDATASGSGEKRRSLVDFDGMPNTMASASTNDASKGKERQDPAAAAAAAEGDDGAAVDALEERAQGRKLRDNATRRQAEQGGQSESLFDADTLGAGIDSKAIDEAMEAARKNAKSALNSVQSFWEKVQADPRMTSMQASVAHTLQNISLPQSAAATGGETEVGESQGAEPDATIASPRTRRNLALPDLSKQFQGAFPHLDWKESQTMAKRYFEASQNAARDWGKEMSHLMGDLVKVVPPERAAGPSAAASTETVAAEKASRGPAAASAIGRSEPLQAAEADDEDFDWDNDVDVKSGGSGLETTTGPPTTSFESTLSDASPRKTAAPTKPSSQVGQREEDNDDEADSDWE